MDKATLIDRIERRTLLVDLGKTNELSLLLPNELVAKSYAKHQYVSDSARVFAKEAHGDQKYGQYAYTYHLDKVVEILIHYGYGTVTQMVGYLHDVLEDTNVTKEEMKAEFGEFLTQCVQYVTDEKGINRKERKEKTNKKLNSIRGIHKIALVVKAADRLANLQRSIVDKEPRYFKMYCKEHTAFRAAAFRSGLCNEMWQRIDDIIENGTWTPRVEG